MGEGISQELAFFFSSYVSDKGFYLSGASLLLSLSNNRKKTSKYWFILPGANHDFPLITWPRKLWCSFWPLPLPFLRGRGSALCSSSFQFICCTLCVLSVFQSWYTGCLCCLLARGGHFTWSHSCRKGPGAGCHLLEESQRSESL